jgi:predicted transcriptional regulator YdeE
MTTESVDAAASVYGMGNDEFRFEKRSESWLICLGQIGPYHNAHQWTGPLWDGFIRRQSELPSPVDHSVYISPRGGSDEEFACYIGFTSPWEVEDLPDGMICMHLPEHWYAVGQVQGGPEDVDRTHHELRAWAVSSGRAIDADRLLLEIYPDRPDYPTQSYDHEIWLPVV